MASPSITASLIAKLLGVVCDQELRIERACTAEHQESHQNDAGDESGLRHLCPEAWAPHPHGVYVRSTTQGIIYPRKQESEPDVLGGQELAMYLDADLNQPATW